MSEKIETLINDIDEEWLSAIGERWMAVTGHPWETKDGETREDGLRNNIAALIQRIESLQQERDAAQKACAAVRQYSHKVSAIGYKEGVVGSHVLMLLEEHGKGWHSPEAWDAVQKANAEMRQRIANCHDRLLRGDTDPELLKLLEGNWGPATGVGITEKKT